MCFGGGKGGGGGPQYVAQWGTDDQGNLTQYYAEAGVPLDFVKRGAVTNTQYQLMAQQDLSDKQITAQKDIAQKQQDFNQQQFDYQKGLAQQQQQQVDEQANRQTEYDQGRSTLLGEGTKKVNDAFSGFSDDYFKNFAGAYMSKIQDQVNFQKAEAQKQLAFGMARQGIGDSQAMANKQGLLAETEGRTIADESVNAQNQANQLRSNVAAARQNLLGQVTSSESIGSPIAASDEPGIQSQLQTQRQAISGVTNSAGDVTASLQGVPTVNTLSNIFASVLGSAGSYLGGVQANQSLGYLRAGLAGRDPGLGTK